MFVGLAAASLVIFVRLALRMRAIGGSVKAERFVLPDLLTATVLIAFFSMGALYSFSHPGPTVSAAKQMEQVLPGAFFILFIAICVGAYLTYRGANLLELLGVRRMPWWQAVGFAALYLVAAVPLILLATAAMHAGQDNGDEQLIVQLFRTEAAKGDYSAIGIIALASVLMAPIGEEFLFRGFFYGVLKRFVGSVGSAVFCSVLFALIHANLASAPGLFVLALALTLVYERTGSILAPISMHALFNLSSLAWLYASARGWIQ